MVRYMFYSVLTAILMIQHAAEEDNDPDNIRKEILQGHVNREELR